MPQGNPQCVANWTFSKFNGANLLPFLALLLLLILPAIKKYISNNRNTRVKNTDALIKSIAPVFIAKMFTGAITLKPVSIFTSIKLFIQTNINALISCIIVYLVKSTVFEGRGLALYLAVITSTSGLFYFFTKNGYFREQVLIELFSSVLPMLVLFLWNSTIRVNIEKIIRIWLHLTCLPINTQL